MPNKSYTYLSNINAKRFALALLVSALLHLIFIHGIHLDLLTKNTTPHRIEVSLSTQVKSLVKAPEPLKTPENKPKASPKKPKKIKPPIEPPEPTPEQANLTPTPTAPVEETIAPTPPAEPTATEPTPAVNTEPVGGTALEDSLKPIETSTAEFTPAYKQFMIQYEVTAGEDKGAIGTAEINYNTTSDNTYTINSVIEPNFIASLILSSLTQTSHGSYSEQGLKPLHYEYAYAKKADKTYSADFDWDNNKLTMHTSKGDTQADLSAGAQDLLSFMFQFMFVPPLQEMNLAITTGRRFRTYTYSFEGEETIQTKQGEIKTLHIMNVRGEEKEKTELWLAIEYRNIPVKIRKTEKDGKVIEQTITSLAIERP